MEVVRTARYRVVLCRLYDYSETQNSNIFTVISNRQDLCKGSVCFIRKGDQMQRVVVVSIVNILDTPACVNEAIKLTKWKIEAVRNEHCVYEL